MFEEICLACGAPVDDGRAYCSDLCQSKDVSPSISSSSSAFSSPHLGYAAGGDVPALIPSMLGTALSGYRREVYSVSSSSASSTSWSLVTDQEDDDSARGVEPDGGDGSDYVNESGIKPPGYLHSTPSSGLSYARRPSGTNNCSTIPLLHRRTSSCSDAKNAHGVPQSAPIPSHTPSLHSFGRDDESYSSDIGIVPETIRVSDRRTKEKDNVMTEKPKRHRNRASLPAHFSLLQVTGSSKVRLSPKPPPAHISPPTPKSSAATFPHSCTPLVHATPRGRLREAGTSRGSRHTRSRSRSPSRTVGSRAPYADLRQSVEQALDPSYVYVPRGRNTRRNSSPLHKMDLSGIVKGSRLESRGRTEAGGLHVSMSPGFGYGRSKTNWEPVGSRPLTGWP